MQTNQYTYTVVIAQLEPRSNRVLTTESHKLITNLKGTDPWGMAMMKFGILDDDNRQIIQVSLDLAN